MEDADARENWRYMIAFRDRLLAAPSLDAAYLALARGAAGETPPLFMNQLAQVVLRSALDGERDPVGAARRGAVLSPAARELPRGGDAARRRRDRSSCTSRTAMPRRCWPCSAVPAVTELEILDDANARGLFRPERRLRHGARLRPRRRGPPRPRGGDGGLDTASPRRSRWRSSRWTGSRTRTGRGSSASTPRRRGSATRSGAAGALDAEAADRVVGAVPARLRGRPRGAAGGRRRGRSG